MRIGNLWIAIGCVLGVCACGNDDDRDDRVLDMSYLTGKNWYYNGWLGDKTGFGSQDLLEIVRLEKGGTLKSIDFGGRQEYIVGKWESDGNNRITLKYAEGKETVWNVQHSGNDYIETIVNAQGSRTYTTEPDYLGNLTVDAFLVNEYSSGNQFRTYVGVDVRGNMNVREGTLLMADGNHVALENHEFFWNEKSPVYADWKGEEREVRFYLRLGKDTHLKLKDTIYGDNLPQRLPEEVNLNVNEQNGTMKVAWAPYPSGKVFYRVEILSEGLDLINPFFISRIQNAGASGLEIKPTTGGEVNRWEELKAGETYVIRLTALLYESGVDPWNDNYGYANVQAVSYFTRKYLKE